MRSSNVFSRDWPFWKLLIANILEHGFGLWTFFFQLKSAWILLNNTCTPTRETVLIGGHACNHHINLHACQLCYVGLASDTYVTHFSAHFKGKDYVILSWGKRNGRWWMISIGFYAYSGQISHFWRAMPTFLPAWKLRAPTEFPRRIMYYGLRVTGSVGLYL